MSDWRFIAQRLPSKEFVDFDLPLRRPKVTTTLSGPGRITATVPVEVAHLKGSDGRPVLTPWGTAIVAEAAGEVRGWGILTEPTLSGANLELDCVGFSGYPKGQPWLGPEFSGVKVDPLDMLRKIWDHLQSYSEGNLGVRVDPLKTSVRIGTAEEDVEFRTGAGADVRFESGPWKLAPWLTGDLGATIDRLAADTPFDFRERTRWVGDKLDHRLELGHPQLGTRRSDLRFVIGENVSEVPELPADEAYASDVLVLGAGEGRTMIRAQIGRNTGRLRRATTVTVKSLQTGREASTYARQELDARQGHYTIKEFQILDHPHARVGSWADGDEVYIEGETGWSKIGVWVRILSTEYDVDSGTVTVAVAAAGGV